jgi:hypothetical protein
MATLMFVKVVRHNLVNALERTRTVLDKVCGGAYSINKVHQLLLSHGRIIIVLSRGEG